MREINVDCSFVAMMTELKKSNNSLCKVCRNANFAAIFTGSEFEQDGFRQPYRADLDREKQLPRSWEHIKNHAKSCGFCRLTYLQISSYNRLTRGQANPPPSISAFDQVKDEDEILLVEVSSGMFHRSDITQCVGFQINSYEGYKDHDKMMLRGLQLRAPEDSLGQIWDRTKREIDRTRRGGYPNCKMSVEFGRAFGGRVVRRDHIDFGLCEKWLKLCKKSHSDCRSWGSTLPSKGASAAPARVIDIETGCLISKFPLSRGYAALSYVWGAKLPALKLTLETKRQLHKARKPRVLSESNPKLAKTVRDAIAFCRKINLRYLWVDSLCIYQDKGVPMDPEILRMADIYSGAALTLVALTATNFDCPLPGVSPGTRAKTSQHQGTVKSLKLISCYPSLFTEIEGSAWFTRAWTLQEAAYSKRLLFFTPSQAVFLCRETMFCEESVWETSDGSSTAASSNTETVKAGEIRDVMLLHNTVGSYPPGIYYSLIEKYTSRHLGVPSDILRACDAIFKWSASDERFGSKCHFGLPEDRFGLALGWTPVGGHSSNKRRIGFPSWTWAGWLGPVEWPFLPDYYNKRGDDGAASGIAQEPGSLDRELSEKFGMAVTPVRRPFRPLTAADSVLEIHTSYARLSVDRKARVLGARDPSTFTILGPNGESKDTLQCDDSWRAGQPDQLEFIVIGARRLETLEPPQYDGFYGCGTSQLNAQKSGRLYSDYDRFLWAYDHWEKNMQDRVAVYLMCIERKENGISERVQVCHPWSLKSWMDMKPEETFIRLG